MRSPLFKLLLAARPPAGPAFCGFEPGTVNNSAQNRAVNPLTRLASRSVMGPSYYVAAR